MPNAADRSCFCRYFAAVLSFWHGPAETFCAVIEFRVLAESDKELLKNWIAADPEHSAKGMTPDFFFNPTSISMAIGDYSGPGIFVRVDPEAPSSVRLHIQFSDNEVRSGKAMLRGWPTFSQGIWNSGVKRMVFESKSPLLIGFCKRCFGFSKVEGTDDYELLREGI
jgi:hypothetical protein